MVTFPYKIFYSREVKVNAAKTGMSLWLQPEQLRDLRDEDGTCVALSICASPLWNQYIDLWADVIKW